MAIWTLALKDLRLLVRDPRAAIILFAMPLLIIFVLGISLGEGFGQKPDDNLRVALLNLDEGQTWSAIVLKDLGQTARIKIDFIDSYDQAKDLVKTGRRAAVLVLGKNFSKRVERCSFLAAGGSEIFLLQRVFPRPGDPVGSALHALFQEDQRLVPLYSLEGINPFYRDGVNLATLDVEVLRDPTQATASSIIDQVAQGTLLRVVMPWMIGRAFEQIGDPKFLEILGREKTLPAAVKLFLATAPASQKKGLSAGLQNGLQNIFPKYNLTAKTWAALTKEAEHTGGGAGSSRYRPEGQGFLNRGAIRYQLLVPSYLVTFAFFLVLTVGWLFVAERRQGTLQRLRAAPIASWQLLLGKLLPCYLLSLFQGFALLLGGRLLFGMSWGPEPLWLIPLVASTSLAAMGLALLIAASARTETQVAILGTLIVLMLSSLSGSLMGDRSLMPDSMQRISRFTPHAWALDAYRQLLTNPQPEFDFVAQACAVLAGFGVAFLALSWLKMKWDFA